MVNWAITIGINRYNGFHHLKHAKDDATAMKNLLIEGLHFDDVFLFTDDSPAISAEPTDIPTQPTYANLRQFLVHQFSRPLLSVGDNLWFFFAGHGRRVGNVDYLLLSDTGAGDLENTALSVGFIAQCLRRCGADNIVLFLDACRDEGSGARGIGIDPYSGVITFYSCQPNEKSWEIDDDINQGSFTYTLMRALRGDANCNCASVIQLATYLREQVPILNQKYNKTSQTPSLAVSDDAKRRLILLPQFANQDNIFQLKYEAMQAERREKWTLAWQLWIRVNIATHGNDMETVEAFSRLTQDAPQYRPDRREFIQTRNESDPTTTLSLSDSGSEVPSDSSQVKQEVTASESTSSVTSQQSTSPSRSIQDLPDQDSNLSLTQKIRILLSIATLIGMVALLVPPIREQIFAAFSHTQSPMQTPIDTGKFSNLVSFGENILSASEGEKRGSFIQDKYYGSKAMEKGDYSTAIANFTNARGINKNSPETLISLNNALIGDKPAFTIGVAAHISSEDRYGLGILRGVALAQIAINGEQGKDGIEDKNGQKIPLKILMIDDKKEPSQDLANLLVTPSFQMPDIKTKDSRPINLSLLGLVAHQTSKFTSALASIYENAGMPIVSPSSTSTALFGKYAYIHPVAPRAKDMADELVRYIVKVKNHRKVAIFYDSNESYSESFGTGTCEASKEQNVLYECIDLKNNLGIEDLVKQKIGQGFSALVVAFNTNIDENSEKAKTIIQAVATVNQERPTTAIELFAGNALYDQTLLNFASTRRVSIVRVSPWNPSLPEDLQQDVLQNNKQFKSINEDKWGTSDVNWYTLMGYNATLTLAQAIRLSNVQLPTTTEQVRSVRQTINSTISNGDFKVRGALGDLHFSRKGYVDQGNFACLSTVGATGSNTSSVPLSCKQLNLTNE